LAAELVEVKRKARHENEIARKRMAAMQADLVACRQRAQQAERSLTMVKDELGREKMASDAVAVVLREKADLQKEVVLHRQRAEQAERHVTLVE
ncbi:unnamed protein product, partial [Laminaria digitata]